MYVALRPLKLTVKDAEGRNCVHTIGPGEEVDVASWDYPNIIAHLNLDWIKWQGEGTPTHEAHKGKIVDMAAYRGEKIAEKAQAPAKAPGLPPAKSKGKSKKGHAEPTKAV